MMPPLTLENALAYSVQVAVLVAAAGLLVPLVRLRQPRAGLVYWRAVLLACLLLPFLQPRVDPAVAPWAVVSAEALLAIGDGGGQATWTPAARWTRVMFGLWLAGSGLWLVRISFGLVRLRALRRAGQSALGSPLVAEAIARLGVRPDVRWVAEASQPVTFGVWHPVVLLPAALRAAPIDLQRAVIAHELVHVARQDWAWVMAEELVRAALWFHPAIWFVLSRIELAREQVVDARAVGLLGARRQYMEALLAFADCARLTAIPAFSRRRQLFQRLSLLSTEVTMSRSRVVGRFALCAFGGLVAAGVAVAAFPIHGAAAPEKAIQPSAGAQGSALKKIVDVRPEYPPYVPADDLQGAVILNITVDERGNVTDAEVLSAKVALASSGSADAELAPVVAEAVRTASLQWKYEPLDQPMAIIVSVLLGESAVRPPERLHVSGNVKIAGRDGLTLHADDAYLMRRSLRASGNVRIAGPEGLTMQADEARLDTETGELALRVGGGIPQPAKIHHVNPAYPAEAQAARVQGVVIMEATVGTDGRITDARILKSVPMLDQAALDGVMQWEYTPTLVDGVAVPVIMTVTVNFTLQ